MSEVFISLYFKHDNTDTHHYLSELFKLSGDRNDADFIQSFSDVAAQISPMKGAGIARAFLNDISQRHCGNFAFQDVGREIGYCCAEGTFGGSGDKFAGRVVKFLYRLCPDIQAQAWGMGDDNPWEFWFKHEDGRLIRHDDEPFNGRDARIRSTIYRWWHEGLPEHVRIGMLNDDDEEDDDEEYEEEDEAATEEQYQEWLSQHAEGSDVEDQIAELVQEEVVEAFGGALAGLFGGAGPEEPAANEGAFDADVLDETVVRQVIADMDEQEKRYDVDGIMKHISRDLKGTVISNAMGAETHLPLSHSLYRMTLKRLLREDAEYECSQQINDIKIAAGSAVVSSTSETKFMDPVSSKKMVSETEEVWVLESVAGKVQVTRIDSRELSTKAA